MPLQQLRNVNFGRFRLNATGASGVGYQLLDQTGGVAVSRTTSGVYQTAPGIYAAYISFPDNFRGQVLWDTGTAFLTASYATEQYNVEENDPRVANIDANVQYLTGAVGNITGTLSTISTQVTQVSGTVNDIYDTLLIVSGNVDAINFTTNQIFGDITTIGTQVTQMSGTLNDVYDAVLNLSGTINILSSSVYAISSSAQIISSSAVYISSSVSLLSGAIADLAQITGTLGNIEAKVDRLIDIQYGRWRIINDQMIFYKEDNTTEVARFDLFDENGNPSMDAVFDRVKV